MTTSTLPAAARAYALLLRLYPAAFREEYGHEMVRAFADLWRDRDRAVGKRAVAAMAILGDTLASALQEHGALLTRDLRYATRLLLRPQHRAFAVASVATLALGITAATSVFALVHAVVLRPLPYAEPARLVRLYETNQALGITSFTASIPNFLSWREQARSFDALAGFESVAGNLGDGTPERVEVVAVSAAFWPMTGLAPVAGRTFTADEDGPDGADVVLISEGLWIRRFARDPGIVGTSLLLNERARTVVGVVPQDAGFASDVDVWVPLAPNPARTDRGNHATYVVGRLAPGVTMAQAEAELARIAAELGREFPVSNGGWSIRLTTVEDWIVGPRIRRALWILLGTVAALLLVASLNVATLQVARATTRLREIGVRLALGASRAGLVRQLATESLLLAMIGGGLGLVLTAFAIAELGVLLPRSIPRVEALAVTWTVAGFALVVSTATALVSGLAPGLVVARADVQAALQAAGRTASAAQSRLRPVLVALQLAVATALVFGAVLLFRSLLQLERLPLGFAPDGVLTARLALTDLSERTHERHVRALTAFLDDLRAQPGVRAASLSSDVPLGGVNTGMAIGPIPHPPSVPKDGIQAMWRIVTPEYFATLRIPLLRGRTFSNSHEVVGDQVPLLVSAGLARQLWPDGRDPIGRSVWTANGNTSVVIGVVGDVRLRRLAEDPAPAMYFPLSFAIWPTMTVAVRTDGAPSAMVGTVREALARSMPRQPIYDVRTLEGIVSASAAEPRLHAVLVVVFATVALVLAVVGVAGLTAYLVSQRTAELAVRLALGSTPGGLVRHVVSGGLRLCLAGTAAGLLLGWWSGRLLAGLTEARVSLDPSTLLVTAATLVGAGLLACWLPARRATRINPLTALNRD